MPWKHSTDEYCAPEPREVTVYGKPHERLVNTLAFFLTIIALVLYG